MSQLLPTLLPPTSSSKAHPPHPAHLHRTHSPTLLLGCYSLLPALGGSPCSGSEPLPQGRGLWVDVDIVVTLPLPSAPLRSGEGAGRSKARWLAAGRPGCLPAGEAAGSSAGSARPWDPSTLSQSVAGRRASAAAHRDRQILHQVSSTSQPGKQLLLPTQPQTQHKAKETVCGVAPHLGTSQPPGSLSLPSSLKAAVHVPLILQQWHQ